MASRSSYSGHKRLSRGEDAELVAVRSNVLYGIETKKINEQKTTLRREIFVVPNITFYDNYAKIFIDFSDYMNNKERSNIKDFIDLLVRDNSFTIFNARWNNRSIDEKTYDLSGTYKFIKIVDDIIFAEVTSIQSYSTNLIRYDKEYFLELPVIEFTNSTDKGKKIIKSYIFNHLGKNSKNSFSYLGARSGDYIQLQTNKEKFQIESISIDNEGKETIVVIGDLEDSSSIGTPNLVILHQKNINKIKLDYDNNDVGKCEIIQNGALVECIDNHTQLQSKLREDTFNNIITQFKVGEFCTRVAEPATEQAIQKIIPSLTDQITTMKASAVSNTLKLSSVNSSLLSKSALITRTFSE